MDIDEHQSRLLLTSLACCLLLATCSTASSPSLPTCPSDTPKLGIYDPQRLKVLDTCQWFHGVVTEAERHNDGDLHILLRPDPNSTSFLNVENVIWCTGFRQDYRWIDVSVFDGEGAPMHERGVATEPGLYFLGLDFLYSFASPYPTPRTARSTRANSKRCCSARPARSTCSPRSVTAAGWSSHTGSGRGAARRT